MSKKNKIEKVTVDFEPLEEFRYSQISNYKFEFMLLNHNMKVVHSPFECKDYIQDIFWCETLERKAGVFGLDWKPGMFDITTPFFYLCLSGGKHILNTRIEPLQNFLNAFEEKLGIKPTVIYETDDPKKIVLKFSKDWTFCGQMLSAYTTLIRISGAYMDGDVIQYLVNAKKGTISLPDYSQIEVERMKGTDSYEAGGENLEKLNALYNGKRPTNTWADSTTIQGAHNNGITKTTNFPKVPVKV